MTPWYYEDSVCWVADCEVCDVPMVVWRRHGRTPPEDELDHMVAALRRVAEDRFAGSDFTIDRVMRQIPEHFHAHARDRDWWRRRMGG